MTVEEAKSILGRIKIHYPEFSSDKGTQKEWIRELIIYDFKDVTKKLEEHLKNEEYGRNIPKLFFLTKYLIPTEEKGRIKHYTVLCPKCGQSIPDTQLERHIQRCIESSTIVRDMKKYYGLEVNYQDLMSMNIEKFERTYQKYLDKMLETSVPEFQTRILMHIKYPEYTEDDINEIIKMIVKENE